MKFTELFESTLDKLIQDRIEITKMMKAIESDVASEDKRDFKRAIELVKPQNVLMDLSEDNIYEASEKSIQTMTKKISQSFDDLMSVKGARKDVDNMAEALSILFTVKYKSLESPFDKFMGDLESTNEAQYKNKRPFLYPRIVALKGTLWGALLTSFVAIPSPTPALGNIPSAAWAAIIGGGVVVGILSYTWTRIKMWFFDYPKRRGRKSGGGGHFFENIIDQDLQEATKELLKARKELETKFKKAYKG